MSRLRRPRGPCRVPGCPELAVDHGFCALHQNLGGWQAHGRRELPPDWERIKLRVLERDHYTCRFRLPDCGIGATEVHHLGDRSDHRMENLVAVCHHCHLQITGGESGHQSGGRTK